MKTIRTLVGRLREFKTASILTPLFIIGEVVLECLIPLTMVSLVDALDGVSLSPVMRLGLILTGLAFASLACGILSARFAATAFGGSIIFFIIAGAARGLDLATASARHP